MQPNGEPDSVTVKKRAATNYLRQPWMIFPLLYQTKILKIEPLLFIYMFSRFFYVPLYEQYFFVRFGSDLLQNTSFPFPNGTTFCLNSSQIDDYAGKNGHKTVELYSNNLVLYGQIAARIPSLFTVLILGPLSDRFGRKPVLLAALFGTTLQCITALVIIAFHLSPYYFILASFLTGLFGDFTGVLAGSFSYIADVSSTKWRTFRIGVIEGMLAIGGALGQYLSGYWLNQDRCNFVPPMWLDLACCLASLLWVILLVPESLPREQRLKRVASKPNGIRAAMEGLKMFLGRMPQYSAWKLWAAVVMLNLPLFNAEGGLLVTLYFLKAPPFDLNPVMIGAFQAIQSLSRAVSVTLVLFVFSVALRMSDGMSSLFGISFQIAANILMGFARTSTQAFVIAVVQGVEAISWAAGRSLMSKLVASKDQGALFSIVASIQSIASLLSSVVWPIIFPLTLNANNLSSGFIYYLMAILDVFAFPLLIALILSDFYKRRKVGKQMMEKEKEKKYLSKQDLETDKLLVNGEPTFYSIQNGSINK